MNTNTKLEGGAMHYVDEGEGDIILFVHGTPTWSFLYRDFIKNMSKNYRAIAIDHIGFGLSEKPVHFEGRPQDHAKNLSAFIQKLDLKNITLVVHDFGGPIGLAAGMDQPERIKQVVLFNTWLWETQSNEAIQKADKIIQSFLGRFLYLRYNFSPRVLLKKGFADKTKLSKEIHRQYIKPFPDKNSRLGLYRIAQSLAGSSEWYSDQWEKLQVLQDKPWLIIWGIKDEFFTPEFLDKWTERLPGAAKAVYQCGHFVQEECTGEAIAAMRKFLNGTK
ncbi:MAG: alpha/beta fold hydrolase [Balneolaceae bacterium]